MRTSPFSSHQLYTGELACERRASFSSVPARPTSERDRTLPSRPHSTRWPTRPRHKLHATCACWNRAHSLSNSSANCFAKVLATNLRREQQVVMPLTPPSGLESVVRRAQVRASAICALLALGALRNGLQTLHEHLAVNLDWRLWLPHQHFARTGSLNRLGTSRPQLPQCVVSASVFCNVSARSRHFVNVCVIFLPSVCDSFCVSTFSLGQGCRSFCHELYEQSKVMFCRSGRDALQLFVFFVPTMFSGILGSFGKNSTVLCPFLVCMLTQLRSMCC